MGLREHWNAEILIVLYIELHNFVNILCGCNFNVSCRNHSRTKAHVAGLWQKSERKRKISGAGMCVTTISEAACITFWV